MRTGYRPHRSGQPDVQQALKRIDDIADKLLRSNETCQICMNHGPMRNCHIVGEKFLALIANTKGQICCWSTSAKSIARLVLPALQASSFRRTTGPIDVDSFPPVHRSKNNQHCKFTFACCLCDNQVLKPTDSVQQFDSRNAETVFTLSLRTFAAYTAWYEGHKKWAEGLRRDPKSLLLLKEHPYMQPALEALSDWGARQTSLGRQLESEMQR